MMEISVASVLLCLLLNFVTVNADLRDKNRYDHNDLQKVPPIKETAEKIHRYFLGGSAEAIHPLWYTRDKNNKRMKRFAETKKNYDVTFLIDASGSIKEKAFYQGIKALNILITKAKPSTKYALIVFSEEGDIKSYFKWPPKKIRAVLKATEYQGFRTNTQDALQKCRKGLIMNITSGVRQGSLKRVLIIYDGLSNIKPEYTLYRAAQLKNLNVEIFVLAVGKYIKGINELMEIATTARWHIYRVETMEGFIEVVKLIPPTRRPQMLGK